MRMCLGQDQAEECRCLAGMNAGLRLFSIRPVSGHSHEQASGETVTGCAGLWADSACVHGDPPAVVKEPDLTGNRGIWGNIEAAVKKEK